MRRMLIVTVAVLLLATATAFMSGPNKGNGESSNASAKKAGTVAPNMQAVASKRLIRIWVHGDEIYPDIIQVSPGTILLEAENQISSNITLVLEQVGQAQSPQLITAMSAQQHENRKNQTLTLSAGQYVFYEQSRPEVSGKLIVAEE